MYREYTQLAAISCEDEKARTKQAWYRDSFQCVSEMRARTVRIPQTE